TLEYARYCSIATRRATTLSVCSCQVPFSIFDWHDRTGNRRVLVQRQVSPRFLVVRTVPRHQLPSAGFAEHDHVVETFATRGSHKSLDEWILPGCVWGGEPFLNSRRLRGGRKASNGWSRSWIRYRGASSHGNASRT